MSADGRPEQTGVDMATLDTRFRTPLMAYFLRRTGKRSEAEDLTQETFIRLMKAQSLDHVEHADFYVFRVASNVLHDHGRSIERRNRYDKSPLNTLIVEELSQHSVEDRGPERVLIGRESLAEVLATLGELGERTKNIFILFRLEGMKQKDIAAYYGMGQSTVEKHVMLATHHIAKRYGPKAP
ncbi:MAG TPA: sigma-70 family RNA polymerase sigma factor [Acidobacteriaceae bacterium]|nr:sigma-70 family RNA polymerase sigma factor [Acidobacteriaceae bacterium]